MTRYKKYSNPYSIDVQRYSIYNNQRPRERKRLPERGDEFTITIQDMDENARGIGFRNGFKVIVPRAVPGEKVRVRVSRIEGKTLHASVIDRVAEPKR